MAKSKESQFATMLEAENVVRIEDGALDHATAWIGANLNPEEVFPEYKLEKWAEANGYVKGGDNEQ